MNSVFNHSMIGDVAQLIGAIVLAFNCWQTFMNGKRGKANTTKLVELGENVLTIEKATNSMKDALVASTAKAAHAEGQAIGLKQGRREISVPLEVKIIPPTIKPIRIAKKKKPQRRK